MNDALPILHPQQIAAMNRGARCQECLLLDCGRGPVPSRVLYGAPVATSGEGPGVSEVEGRENFIGWSGEILDACIWDGGQTRYSTTIINAIACQQDTKLSLEEYETKELRRRKRLEAEYARLVTPGVAIERRAEIERELAKLLPTEACRPRFELDLDEAAPRVYLAVGKQALASMERYLRSRFAYDGDELVMARMHGAPVPLATPRQALERAQATLMTRIQASEERGTVYTDGDLERVVRVLEWTAQHVGWDTPRYLFGSYHPAFAAKGRSPQWMSTVCMNITRAVSVASRGQIDWVEPQYIIAPPVREALNWLADQVRRPGEGIVDLETCDAITGRPSLDQHRCAIRTIGLWNRQANDSESILVMPFRHMDGSLWGYSAEELAALAIAYRTYFDSHPLAGHNVIPFDSEIMLRPTCETLSVDLALGGHLPLMSVRHRLMTDTRVLVHNTRRQDLPKTLSETGRWYFEVPEWKSKEDVASTDNADDGKLLLRCGRDVLVTGRAVDQLRRDVERDETVAQHLVDTQVGNILRDMSELGMCVDERERGKLSRVLNVECDRILKEWHEIVGKDVNPRSVQQMQTLMFEDWGIEPPVNTDGDWSKSATWDEQGEGDPFETDEGSTGAQSILRIIDAIDEGTLDIDGPANTQRIKQALDKVLEFKALDKPRGSYSDNIDVRPWPGPHDRDTSATVPAEGALAERDAISWARGTWAIPVTPVGRSVVARPGLQQIPQLGRKLVREDGSIDEINMRRVYRAAPGHCFVAADFMQSHVRIYYAVAQDAVGYDTLARKLNPHVHHVSTLLADHPSKTMEVYEKIWAMKKSAPDDFEYWKLVAKKFCIAEGSPVLTDKGQVPIERVKESMRVWDGLDFVRHDGVIDQGVQDVIEYDGLTATPDHECWFARDVSARLDTIASMGFRLTRTGDGSTPLAPQNDLPRYNESSRWVKHSRTRTFDILNAGPHHRFTVSDILSSNCFGTIYGGAFMTIYKVMKKERERATGKRSFPSLKPQDCERWESNWYAGHTATRPWQELELALYEQRGYAMSAILDQRRRYGPLDMTMIPNHAILAFEGSLKNKALIEIAQRIPHRGWSAWSGLVGDFHDCPLVQVPIPRAREAVQIVVDAMGYRWRDMDFGGEGKIGPLWGAMVDPSKWKDPA